MPKKLNKTKSSELLSEIIIRGIKERKGEKIISLNLKNIDNAISDYFIVCHGNSNIQVNAIAESIEEEVQKAIGMKPWHKEGIQNAEWILLDYVDVVVHIFQEVTRNFYQLEKLWADAEIKIIEED